MSDFRIFCELLAKTMLESIDFTDVLEGYRRNEKPEKLGIATILRRLIANTIAGRNEKPEKLGIATLQLNTADSVLLPVEMKSPRNRAL